MDIQIPQILFQIVNFAVVLVILTKFLYKPILKTIDERAQKIKDGLEAAEKNIKLQTQTETDRDQTITKAKKEAAKIISEAKSEADLLLSKAQVQAKEQAKKTLAGQKEALRTQMESESTALRHQAALLVTKATEAVLRDSLSSIKVQKSLIDKQIQALSPKFFN